MWRQTIREFPVAAACRLDHYDDNDCLHGNELLRRAGSVETGTLTASMKMSAYPHLKGLAIRTAAPGQNRTDHVPAGLVPGPPACAAK